MDWGPSVQHTFLIIATSSKNVSFSNVLVTFSQKIKFSPLLSLRNVYAFLPIPHVHWDSSFNP